MGGTVMSTHSQDTSAMLQQAARTGLPVLIPGAFEKRVVDANARTATAAAEAATPHVRVAGYDRGRLEREREGGGAPSERTGRRHATILARVWHCVLHPTDLPSIWRRPLPSRA